MKLNILSIMRGVTYGMIVMVIMMIADLSHADTLHSGVDARHVVDVFNLN